MENLSREKIVRLSLILSIPVLGFFAVRGPLESPRPTIDAPEKRAAVRHEDVEARLWQDPFYPVAGHEQKFDEADRADEEHHGSAELRSQITDYLRDANVVVLPVMVSGAPYPEDVERRKRSRYAVIAALHKHHYHPMSPRHIGYARMADWPPAEPSGDDADHTHDGHSHGGHTHDAVLLPFEWFESPQSGRRALVLWVAEEITAWPVGHDELGSWPSSGQDYMLRNAPLLRLSQLLGKVLPEDLREPERHSVQARIIGPAGSTTLLHMVRESKWYESYQHPLPFPRSLTDWNTRIYSPWATMDEGSLGLSDGDEDPRSQYTLRVGLGSVPLIRTIHTDAQVLQALIDELARRNVDVRNDRHHIVLISESDTPFGRSLPEVFDALVRQARKQQGGEDVTSPAVEKAPPPNMRRYTYLRGIDGRLPDSEPTENTREAATPGFLPGQRLRAMEPAAGRGQLDYLQRMVQALRAWDRDLRRGHATVPRPGRGFDAYIDTSQTDHDDRKLHGRVRAIGVLGSDVYDKILIMKALRPEFPDVVFFTTDMDAIYDDPGELASVRNIIIGSTFGLRLSPYWQAEFPPFRNSYQAAMYLATRLALMDDESNRDDAFFNDHAPKDWLDDPRILEIGTRGHVDLTPSGQGEETTWALHPVRQQHAGRGLAVAALLAATVLLAAAVLLGYRVAAWQRLYRQDPQRLHRRTPLSDPFVVMLASLGIGLALAWLILVGVGDEAGTGKPALGLHGVSTWISDGLHLAAVGVAGALTFKCLLILCSLSDPLLMPEGKGSGSRTADSVGPTIRAWWPNRSRNGDGRAWAGPVAGWVLMTIVVLVVFALIVLVNRYSFGGRSLVIPWRGPSSWITCTSWGLALAGSTLLVVCVSDMIRRCTQFVRTALGGTAEPGARLKGRDVLLEAKANVQRVSDVTAPVVGLVTYPLFALMLLTTARLPVFDGWGWPPLLVGLLVALTAVPVAASVHLHFVAKSEREAAVRRLRRETSSDESELEAIRKIDGGAFLPLWRDPVAEAIMFPIALAAGVLMVIQWAPTL